MEFMKYVCMVDALQELLGLWKKTLNRSRTAASSMAVSSECSSLHLSKPSLTARMTSPLPPLTLHEAFNLTQKWDTLSEEEWKMICQAVTIIVHTILGPLDPWSVLDVLPTHSAPPPNDMPPSQSSTPSSLAPSSVVHSSNMGPPPLSPPDLLELDILVLLPFPALSRSSFPQTCIPLNCQVQHLRLASPTPPKTKCALHVKPTPAWSKWDKPSTPTSNPLPPSPTGSEVSSPMYKGAQIVPEWQSPLSERECTLLRTTSEGASSESEGIFNLKSLKQDKLMDWINNHLIEAISKQVTKKEIIKAISTASPTEQPTQEEIQEIIQNVLHIKMKY
ncbi:hypothetical protein V8E53_003575 [Lactarius tabidus]